MPEPSERPVGGPRRFYARVVDAEPLGGASADAPLESPRPEGYPLLALGARSPVVRIEGLTAPEAELVEREVLAVGGRLTESHPGPPGGTGRRGWTLVANGPQYRAWGERLRASGGGLGDLATAVEGALGHRYWKESRLVRGLHRSFRVGARTVVMGIVNITPDSFSDGGRFLEPEAALAHAVGLVEEGAGLVDLGGESTRPGATAISPDTEWRRVGPVLARLRARVDVPISVDTRHPEVAGRALSEGADLINDVTGLRDPEMRRVVARHGAPVIVMHMRGDPATMQTDVAYADLRAEVFAALSDACAQAVSDGIAPEQLLVDPGLGFGKAPEHNFELIAHLGELRSLGFPVVVGASRKSFLGWALGGAPREDRGEAGIAAAVAASLRGADVVRVHDVRPTVRALAIADRLRGAGLG